MKNPDTFCNKGHVTPGTYVETHGAELTFDEAANMVGRMVIMDLSTESRSIFMAVRVAAVVIEPRVLLPDKYPPVRRLVLEYYRDRSREAAHKFISENRPDKLYRMAETEEQETKNGDNMHAH